MITQGKYPEVQEDVAKKKKKQTFNKMYLKPNNITK